MSFTAALVLVLYATLALELLLVAVPSRVSARQLLRRPEGALVSAKSALHRSGILITAGLPLILSVAAFAYPLLVSLFPNLIPHNPPHWRTQFSASSRLGLVLALVGRGITWTAMDTLRRRGAGHGGPLVTDGLFARSRHPGLVGMFLFAAGLYLLYPGWVFGLALFGYALHMDRKARAEEKILMASHPSTYPAYAASVPRYVGRVKAVAADEPTRIAGWFDRTYREKGLRYLRPLAAYRHFPALLGLEPGHRYLDIGCGPGLLLEAAASSGAERFGLDLSKVALGLARERGIAAGLVHGSALALPFPDGQFDRISCIGTIERFPDRPLALREMLRVAKADARFCFMVRNARTLGWRILKQTLGRQSKEGHEDALGLEEWQALFQGSGFEVLRVEGDPWPRVRAQRGLRRCLGLDPDRVSLGTSPLLPLRYANEFIFVLGRAARSSS